jgi:hypothetical protein
MMSTPTGPSGRTTGQTILIVVGSLVLLAGLVCVVLGFVGFVDAQDDLGGTSDNRSMALFAGGAFAMVVGFGIVAFTRASVMTRNGAYARVTIEQGVGPRAGGRFCSGCGRETRPGAQFCDSCGAAVG